MNNININSIMTNVNSTNINTKTKNIENKANSSVLSEDDKKLKEACQEFESIFVGMMLKQMRKTVIESGFTEKSSGREIFEGMYDEEMSKNISKNEEGIGLAKVIYESMKQRKTL